MHIDIPMDNEMYNVDFKIDGTTIVIERFSIDGLEREYTDDERLKIIAKIQDHLAANMLFPEE